MGDGDDGDVVCGLEREMRLRDGDENAARGWFSGILGVLGFTERRERVN